MRPAVLKGASTQGEAGEVLTEERCFLLETWNHDSDPGVSVARARVPPGVTTALHRLSVDERYLVTSGEGRVEVEGISPAQVSAGDVVLIPAGKAQRITNLGSEDLVFLCICTPRFEPRHYADCEKP